MYYFLAQRKMIIKCKENSRLDGRLKQYDMLGGNQKMPLSAEISYQYDKMRL